ncbi:MAG: helix-turn-helix transcriptional regulator [Acidobacteria bacterium]|nr:helix-turn-helix transcriptional regulator [Acidobacteriota bacterium]
MRGHLLLLTPAPITPVMLHVLIVLGEENRHGYAIMQAVSEISEGRFQVGPGTFYANLEKLLSWGLVREAASPDPGRTDPRRRYYALTDSGRQVLDAELTRLESLLKRARSQKRYFTAGN